MDTAMLFCVIIPAGAILIGAFAIAWIIGYEKGRQQGWKEAKATFHIPLWSVIALLFCASPLCAGGEWACVRIPSHGGSGVVIYNGPERSYILTAAHMFEGQKRNAKVVLDILSPEGAKTLNPGVRVLKVSSEARTGYDLALLEVNCPLPYCCPVAQAGHKASKLLSVGYDEMRTPMQVRPATIIRDSPTMTNTRERPWQGRSGGGLIDAETGQLIGIVSGFTLPQGRGGVDRRAESPQEIYPGSEGRYTSLQAIHAFLGNQQPAQPDWQQQRRENQGAPYRQPPPDQRRYPSGPGYQRQGYQAPQQPLVGLKPGGC